MRHSLFAHIQDDLPIWGMVGEILPDSTGEEKIFLYTHKRFVFSWNKDRIIEVNLTSENPIALENEVEVRFTYSVTWEETATTFEKRFEKYLDDNFFEHQVSLYLESLTLDSLVFHFQLVHDGRVSHWFGLYDSSSNSS